jgi:hypothetical protein
MSDLMFSQTCVCSRMFTDLGGFTRHEKAVARAKKTIQCPQQGEGGVPSQESQIVPVKGSNRKLGSGNNQ